MALRVTTPIGTDRGLIQNAYIRIGEYRVLKTGECIFDIHIYKSQEDAIIADSSMATIGKANERTCFSLEIGKEVKIDLGREIVKTVTVPKEIPMTVKRTKTIGSHSYEVTENMITSSLHTYETKIKVPNWNALQNNNIFEFGYAVLKDRLVELYGAENVVDDTTISVGVGPFANELTSDIQARERGDVTSFD